MQVSFTNVFLIYSVHLSLPIKRFSRAHSLVDDDESFDCAIVRGILTRQTGKHVSSLVTNPVAPSGSE